MAEYFQVELDTLGRYVTTLREAQQHLADLPKLLTGNDTDLGNDDLDDAAEQFQRCWEHGAKQLGELVTETTDAVLEVQQAYAGTDQALSAGMKGFQQPLDVVGRAGDQLNHNGAPGA